MLHEMRQLEKVVLPEGVKTVGDMAFYYCGPLFEMQTLRRVQLPLSFTRFQA